MLGTPVEIADRMQQWFESRAADGFNVMPPFFPEGLEDFTQMVVPILQERGLFRTQYDGSTLREHLGLVRFKHYFRPNCAKYWLDTSRQWNQAGRT